MTAAPKLLDDPLDLFRERCHVLARRVAAGQLGFIDGVDMSYSAAIWSGLVDRVGDDEVQSVLAAAFMGAQKERAP